MKKPLRTTKKRGGTLRRTPSSMNMKLFKTLLATMKPKSSKKFSSEGSGKPPRRSSRAEPGMPSPMTKPNINEKTKRKAQKANRGVRRLTYAVYFPKRKTVKPLGRSVVALKHHPPSS